MVETWGRSSPGAGRAHVAILTGTSNGARFRAAQLATIAAQGHADPRLALYRQTRSGTLSLRLATAARLP